MMKNKALVPILFSLVVVGCHSMEPAELSGFRSDGCSCFPDGTRSEPSLWTRDCLEHDRAYWLGGTGLERKLADERLRDEICRKGNPVTARIVYAGVRIGGTPWLPTPWRWGFGWREVTRGYREISDEERRIADGVIDLPGVIYNGRE